MIDVGGYVCDFSGSRVFMEFGLVGAVKLKREKKLYCQKLLTADCYQLTFVKEIGVEVECIFLLVHVEMMAMMMIGYIGYPNLIILG